MNGVRVLIVIDSAKQCECRQSSAFVSLRQELVKTLKRTFLSYLFVTDVVCLGVMESHIVNTAL